jgi:hypothetical protein
MSDKTSELPGAADAGETRVRGGSLSRDERRVAVDNVAVEQLEDTDKVLRTDDEKDTLYQDGLDLDDKSRPLTGINGRDDS